MEYEELKKRARNLPSEPGVYIMRDKDNHVIYVGKAKNLKNRVSQYFQDTVSHSPKTKKMVSCIDHFDVFVAASEFEALILECAQIKQHMPKYNILLKDGKGYPYLRLDIGETYPAITMVAEPANDGANYYGPFGSRGITKEILKTIKEVFKLPSCSKKFPKDIGKGRACLHYHMGQCFGWCQNADLQKQYGSAIEQAHQLLQGNYKSTYAMIQKEMLQAADELNFELAATLRDRMKAVESLGRKQLMTAGRNSDTDIIGFACTEVKACFSILHFRDGNLVDKDYEILPIPDDVNAAVTALVKQYYLNRGFAPKLILLPCQMDDGVLFEELLFNQFGKRTKIKVPQRGENHQLLELAHKNAIEEAERVTKREDRLNATLVQLGKTLNIDVPVRIEAYDISNISGTDIVAGMVVFCDGKPKRSEYKKFKINDLDNQDDYASMHQVIFRRFLHLKNHDKGFDVTPNLVLIDGGEEHAAVAEVALESIGMKLNVFGMVKDDRHRTRALVTSCGNVIHIDSHHNIFSLIGNIQEETHRFAIGYHRNLRSNRLKYSALDEIAGIGPKRKQLLLKKFKSLSAIGQASYAELEQILPKPVADTVYNHFRNSKEGRAEYESD